MTNVKDLLLKQWEEEKLKLAETDPEKKETYRLQVDRVNQLERQLTELERTEIEVEEKAASRYIEEQLERDKMEEERKANKSRNRIEVAKIAAPLSVAFLTAAISMVGIVSMVFEKTDIVSSTAGKNSLRDLINFKRN